MQLRCTSPRTVGFYEDGKTICWSPKKYSKQYATFQLPCGKCIACRLENARQTAVRCVHEALMYEKNSFITLTYSDEHLKSPKLHYPDFQKFVKRLRSNIYESHKDILENKEDYEKIKIGVFVAGEYGDKEHRPHWHAIIFNWRPEDCTYYRTTNRGDRIFRSKLLDDLWGFNDPEKRPNEIGEVTFHSAGYVARYAAKKLCHGKDGTHDYNPIAKRSSKNAIGKKYLEKFWPDVFNHGYCIIPQGDQYIRTGVPRYYETWFKKNHPDLWKHYVTVTKQKIINDAILKEENYLSKEEKINHLRLSAQKGLQIKRNYARQKILEQKFHQLQQNLKL